MKILRRHSRGPRVELVCVGSELLIGKVNTHGAYLSAIFEDLGLPLVRETTVSDDPHEMESLFREVWNRADVVLVTGGLGPTFDDVTRDVWAKVCGTILEFHRELLEKMAERFRRRGIPMPPANRRQAYLLKNARVLENANGTAPGQRLDQGGKILFLLPGPGREMKPMVEKDVVPALRDRFPTGCRRTRVWRFFGLPESQIDHALRRILTSKGGLTWGIIAQEGVVDVKMTLTGPSLENIEKSILRWDAKMRTLFGEAIFGNEGDTLESVVGGLLRRKGKTLAVAESCTGGSLAQKITSVSGSSDYFWGGVVSYANAAKGRLLEIKNETIKRFGAVSKQTAREMAESLLRKSGTDFVLSITGIAGPSGGTLQKPVGRVYIGMAGPGKTRVWEKNLGGDRSLVRTQSVLWALDFLRRNLSKGKPPG